MRTHSRRKSGKRERSPELKRFLAKAQKVPHPGTVRVTIPLPAGIQNGVQDCFESPADAAYAAGKAWLRKDWEACRQALEYFFEHLSEKDVKRWEFQDLKNAATWFDMIRQTGISRSSSHQAARIFMEKASGFIAGEIPKREKQAEDRDRIRNALYRTGCNEVEITDLSPPRLDVFLPEDRRDQGDSEKAILERIEAACRESPETCPPVESDHPGTTKVVIFPNPCIDEYVRDANRSYRWSARAIIFPHDFDMLDQLASQIIPVFYNEEIEPGLKKYKEIKLVSANPLFAKIGETGAGETYGAPEIGLALELDGPFPAVRAAVSELGGLGREQRHIFLARPGQTETAPTNGAYVGFRFDRKLSLSTIQRAISTTVLPDYKIEKTTKGYGFRHLVFNENDSVMKVLYRLFSACGEDNTWKMYRTRIEILGNPSTAAGRFDRIDEYEEYIVNYFGKFPGNEISDKAFKRGQAFRQGASGIGPDFAFPELDIQMRKKLYEMKRGQMMREKIVKLPKASISFELSESSKAYYRNSQLSTPHTNLGNGYFLKNEEFDLLPN